jgi:lipoprotein
MKKILLLLATMLVFTACQRDAQPSIPEPDDASGKTRQVALDLEGDISDPLNEFARALELEPGTSGGRSTLAPKFTDGEEVNALCAVSSQDGTKGSDLIPIKLKVSGGGKKLTFKGDVSVRASVVANPQVRLSVFIGFSTATGPKTLEAYPTTAPHYAETGPRTAIKDFPVALQAKAEVSVETSDNKKFCKEKAMKFRLIGSLIRCKITNDTEQSLTITGLELHGLGATGLKLARPKDSREFFATSDNTSPEFSIRTYMLPSALTLQSKASAGSYIVYAPLVSKEDGRDQDYEGYIRPVFSDATLQAKYLAEETSKVFPQDKAGKLALTTILIRKSTSPIRPNAIPLQYWNYSMYYKPQGGSASVIAGTVRPGIKFPFIEGEPYRPFWNNVPTAFVRDSVGLFFRANDVSVSHEQIKNLELNGKKLNLHIPTIEEVAGIFPPNLIATNNHPVYYQSTAPYSGEKTETVEVAGQRFAGKSSFWRGSINGSLPEDLLNILVGQGNLSHRHPIYALRFGKPTAAEVQAYKAAGGDESLLVKDNKSRVAYMYVFELGRLRIHSCYIGENSEINTAQDLETKQVFRNASGDDQLKFNGHKVVGRFFLLYGPTYTDPNVGGGKPQFPVVTRSSELRYAKLLKGAYPSASIPAEYDQSARAITGPSGLLCRKSSTDNSLVGHWIVRTKENYGASEKVFSYVYKTGSTTTAYIKDLPQDGTRYFSFLLCLFSDIASPSATIPGN